MLIKLAGYGSVVLLDYFHIINPKKVKLNLRYVNTCFSSQFSNRIASIKIGSGNNLSKAQIDVLQKDFHKDFFNRCLEKEVDYIILDFINERMPVVKLSNGAVITYSTELKHSRLLEKLEYKIIEPYTNEYFEMWAACWDSFVRKAKASDILHKVIINKIYWAKRTSSGIPFPDRFTDSYIYENNIYLYKLYSYCSKDIPISNFISYGSFTAADDHRWGVTPFHFTDDLYKSMSLQMSFLLNN